MSSSILVINAAGRETRVALVENGHIAEFYLERKKDKGIVGNIYKGRVVRVLPGMQAAFVDIGLDKAAFLYVSDVFYDPDLSRSQFELTEGEHEEPPEAPDIAEPTEEGPSSSNETTAAPQSTVEAGEEVSQPLNPAPAASDAPPQGDTGSPSLEAVSPPSSTLGLETGDAVPDAAAVRHRGPPRRA